MVIASDAEILPVAIAKSTERVRTRFLEFFTTQIRNPNTRRSYVKAASELLSWCDVRGVQSLNTITPINVAGWVEEMTGSHSAPTVKQRLGAVRQLFDWLVTGQAI
ncbi:site-specific integrase (plasmid) [Ensifer adhaerens]|uniref:site-specific integrase n=1 Tax=Ensifer adhaerens TaxID=106592 RepID=UPI002101C8DB|nr:site-specific integrase [Ensifer adhaerens]UTV41786.1 site-specific integrase [Ensifer adhaerens]